LQPAARLPLLGARHRAAPRRHAGRSPARVALVRGRHRTLPAPDEHPRHRDGWPLPRRPGGQPLPRLRPHRAGHQPGADRARRRHHRELRAPSREPGAGAGAPRARGVARARRDRSNAEGGRVTAAHPELGPALWAAWRHPRASRAELRAWQDARLRRLVRHAYDSVPFYRRLFDRHRLHPRHIRGVVDLDLIPTTDKATMRTEGGAALLARGHDTASLLTVRTSGSSGEPFTIHRTWLEDKLQYLLRLRTFGAFGVRHRDRVVAVGVGGRPDSGEDKLIGRSLRALGFHSRELVDGL